MKIKFGNFIFDDKVVETIEKKCFEVGAHNFNKYLRESKYGGKPVIDVLKDIKESKEFAKIDVKEKDLNLSLDKQKEIVVDFYTSLNSELGKLANNILNQKDNRYCVNITMDTTKDNSGNVGTHENSKHIHFDVNTNGGIEGLRILCHETSHAMSGHKTKSYEILNNGTEDEQKEFFRNLGKYSKDSIGEVESHIVEFLFMDYLLDKNIITKSDYQKFEDKRNNSTINNINTILEESYIFDHITPPITPDKFEKFEKKIGGIIKTRKYKKLMNRAKFMFNRNEHSGYSQYDFRYVIGDIVSSNWFEKYTTSTTKQKQEMKNNFVDYLSKTHKMDLQSCCLHLLNTGIGNTVSDYISKQQLSQ